jgi:hypothetical protein
MPYPPLWRPATSDRGTATAVLVDGRERYLGYLNVTPRQANETLPNWASFRTDHNMEEGDRNVRRLAAAGGLRFSTGRGSCIRDSYTTKTGARFIELACLVDGARASSVIVGAAPPQLWPKMAPVLERAISSFTT